MTNRRVERIAGLRWLAAGFLFIGLGSHGLALAAEPLKKVRMAIPSIVIDFAPLWIAREKGIFRDERIDPEITYIQGNVRVVQSLVAGEVQFGIAGTAGAVSARAVGSTKAGASRIATAAEIIRSHRSCNVIGCPLGSSVGGDRPTSIAWNQGEIVAGC